MALNNGNAGQYFSSRPLRSQWKILPLQHFILLDSFLNLSHNKHMISQVITKMYLWGHSKLVQDLEDLDIGGRSEHSCQISGNPSNRIACCWEWMTPTWSTRNTKENIKERISRYSTIFSAHAIQQSSGTQESTVLMSYDRNVWARSPREVLY